MTEPAYADISLGGGRLTLRPWRTDDAPVMATACADPEIALFCMMPAGYTAAMARDFIADAPRAWAEDGWLHLALTTADGRATRRSGGRAALPPCRSAATKRRARLLGDARRARPRPGARRRRARHRLGLRDTRPATAGDRHDGGQPRLAARRPLARLPARGPAAQLPAVWARRTDCIVYSLLSDEWRARRAAGGDDGQPQGPPPADALLPPNEAHIPPDEALLPALAGARADYAAVTPALPPTPPPLGDGAIALRPYSEADVPDLVRACNDPESQRWLFMLPTPYTESDAREFLALAATGWEKEHRADYCIADAASGRLLGGVTLRADESWAGVAEIGYHVAPWARRRGVATAAARLVAHWALEVLGLARVQILADTRNAGSCAVATGLGFTREGLYGAPTTAARATSATTPSSRCWPATRTPGRPPRAQGDRRQVVQSPGLGR